MSYYLLNIDDYEALIDLESYSELANLELSTQTLNFKPRKAASGHIVIVEFTEWHENIARFIEWQDNIAVLPDIANTLGGGDTPYTPSRCVYAFVHFMSVFRKNEFYNVKRGYLKNSFSQ